MSRTVFVNPSFVNPRKRKAGKKKARKRAKKRWTRGYIRGRVALAHRQNAGIAPFLQQNPLILSNPRPRTRRRRRSNPSMPSGKDVLGFGLTTFGGAAAALTVNTVGTSKIDHAWIRRGSQFGAAMVGGMLIGMKSEKMGAAFAGSMMTPLLQDLAADLLSIGVAAGASSKEADIDSLAADLEDVLDGMDGSELGDDDDEEEYAW